MHRSFFIALFALGCGTDTKTAPPRESDLGSSVDCSDRSYTVPSTRGEMSGVWDEDRSRFVFFGGDEGTPINCIPQPEFLDQVWAFHTDCDSFEQLETGSTWPHARTRHAVALDSRRNQMLVHGGRYRESGTGSYTLFDDLWSFNLETNTWSQLSDGDGPTARVTHTMVVAGDKLLLYGGNTTASSTNYQPAQDLWSYDLVGDGGWEVIDGDAEGGKRLFHAATVSADGKTMYVYGGADENALLGPFFDDLWALDVNSTIWRELHDGSGTAPDARIWPNLVFDEVANRLLLWAGHDDKPNQGNTNQIWAFDLTSATWEMLAQGDTFENPGLGFCDFPADFTDPDLSAPERRYAGAAAINNESLIVFGGKTDCGQVNDLWTWDLEDETWTERSDATFGEICFRTFAHPEDCESLCF